MLLLDGSNKYIRVMLLDELKKTIRVLFLDESNKNIIALLLIFDVGKNIRGESCPKQIQRL